MLNPSSSILPLGSEAVSPIARKFLRSNRSRSHCKLDSGMSSSNSPCAACKFLRRKCTQGCVFAPYFPPDQPQKFANVHRVFGASNVAKLLNDLIPAHREDTVNSLAYEAEARLHDPVYGCVAYIHILQQRVNQIENEIYAAKKELSAYMGPAALAPLLPAAHHSAFGMAAFQQQPYGVSMGLGVTSATNQPILSREQQQQIEAQQLAAVAAREQEMLRSIGAQQQQQQSEINARFGNNGGFVDGRVFNNNNNMSAMQVAATATDGASPSSGLTLVPSQQFDGSSFHIQQQQIQIQHHYAEQHLQMQQQQHQHRAGSDEGRSGSIGPTS